VASEGDIPMVDGKLEKSDDDSFKYVVEKDIRDGLDALIESEQEAKLALPSRKEGQDRVEYIQGKKEALVSKSWDSMSDAEKKMAMGLELSDDELDSL
jgi:hypothetical protein